MSNLRHWHSRTTSATSSSTSATRRVAAAEELLRDFSKLDPLGLCPLSRCILLLPGRSLSFTCVTPRLLAPRLALSLPRLTLSKRGVCRSGLYHGWVRWRQASLPGALPCRSMLCADVPRALQVGTLAPSALWRPCRACTSCPADR